MKETIVQGFFTIKLKIYSDKTAETTQVAISSNALVPKITTAAIMAGTSAITTSNMIFLVEELSWKCGDDTLRRLYFFSITIFSYFS